MAAVGIILAVTSVLYRSSSPDSESVAKHSSSFVESRMHKLDRYVARLASSQEKWPDIGDLPSDMVIYKYDSDTLTAWYNLFNTENDDISQRYMIRRLANAQFSIESPLATATEKPTYINMGPEWYLVKSIENDSRKIIAGLKVKNTMEENLTRSRNGVNRHLHVHGRFNVAPLSESEGTAVTLNGEPVFKVVNIEGTGSTSPLMVNVLMLWTAIILLSLAAVAYLLRHRGTRRCSATIALFVILAYAGRAIGGQLGEFFQLFSPTLYAHDGLLDSFGTLCIFNTYIFLCMLSMYLCRRRWSMKVNTARWKKILYLSILSIAILASLAYTLYTIGSLIMNSSITMDLYMMNRNFGFSAAVLLSYSFLGAGVLLLIECLLVAISEGRDKPLSMMSKKRILLFAIIMTILVGGESSWLGFKKEESRITVWSNRLAVDRDLVLEIDLKRAEQAIASDPVLGVLCHLDNSEGLMVRRLEEMHLLRATQDYDISVFRIDGKDSDLRAALEDIMVEGVPIVDDSRFLYKYDSSTGGGYHAVFTYYDRHNGAGSILLSLEPRLSKTKHGYSDIVSRKDPHVVNIPNVFSYAKYYQGRLVAFQGTFPYPTVLHGLVYGSRESKKSFVDNGWRHFVNHIGNDEIIVMTRRERRIVTYVVAYSYLVLLLFAAVSIFRPRKAREERRTGHFSSKMRKLITSSLFVALVAMTSVSVVFVYQHNTRNMKNMLSAKISGLQLQLDAACRQMNGIQDMQTPQFIAKLQETASSAECDIDLYSTDGRMFLCSSSDGITRKLFGSRIDPVAFRAITVEHQRFYIIENKFAGRVFHTLYAPIFNSNAQTLAIIGTPYIQTDYDFMRDAVFHAATIVTLFIILLLITIVWGSSIIKSIFQPLTEMGEKMISAEVDTLEPIQYNGNDEISTLVNAYNKMVVDLRDSTSRLAAAERDKAWSEMARQVAHEIKNPLTPIKLEIQRLQRLRQKNDPQWEEKFDKVSAVVLEHIDILSETANEFSTFAKLYSEDPVEIDLNKTLSDELTLYQNREGVHFTYLGTSNAIINGPKPQLVRVFVNLINNALQAVEEVENPTLLVSLRKAKTDWEIVFEDNGPGVSEENRNKLFTPNFTTKSSGTGLGLAICRSIVDRMGGSISYSKSFSLGGACFTVRLPRK